tara:strand:- start:212 stop:598 length:387 start_codon:yes stop_codon:yes gene_type:complete
MRKFLYFGTSTAPIGQTTEDGLDCLLVDASKLRSIEPGSSPSETMIYFSRNSFSPAVDRIQVFHDDNTATHHRCKDISRALGEIISASPHEEFIDVIDFYNNKTHPALKSFVTSITIDSAVIPRFPLE